MLNNESAHVIALFADCSCRMVNYTTVSKTMKDCEYNCCPGYYNCDAVNRKCVFDPAGVRQIPQLVTAAVEASAIRSHDVLLQTVSTPLHCLCCVGLSKAALPGELSWGIDWLSM